MNRKAVAILTAVRTEARAVARAFGMTPPSAGKPVYGWTGERAIELHLIGIRARYLPVLDPERVRCIVLAGFAGALDPSLRVGDLVVTEGANVLQDSHLCRFGSIHTSGHIVSTPEEKAGLFARTGAVAVDMEHGIVREYARSLGVPFVAVRAISDAAGDVLDPLVLRLVNEWGRPRPAAVAGALLRRPTLLPQLIRLGANANQAAVSLTAALPGLVAGFG
jgi:adenosylhomocysteine nucleosidase